MNLDPTPRQAIRNGVKLALEPLIGSLATAIYNQFDPAIEPEETPHIRLINLTETVERANSDEDLRTLQLAVQAICTAGRKAMDNLERAANAIEMSMADHKQFNQYTEHPIDGLNLIETQFPELDDQPTAYVALVYQITYTTQREA